MNASPVDTLTPVRMGKTYYCMSCARLAPDWNSHRRLGQPMTKDEMLEHLRTHALRPAAFHNAQRTIVLLGHGDAHSVWITYLKLQTGLCIAEHEVIPRTIGQN